MLYSRICSEEKSGSQKMNAVCKVCGHPDREKIDAGIAAGVGYEKLAATFGLSPSGISRHKSQHMNRPLEIPASRDPLVCELDQQIKNLSTLQRRAMRKADKNPYIGAALVLQLSRELRNCIRERAQLARHVPKIPVEPTEPELDADQLASMASALLAKHGKGKPN